MRRFIEMHPEIPMIRKGCIFEDIILRIIEGLTDFVVGAHYVPVHQRYTCVLGNILFPADIRRPFVMFIFFYNRNRGRYGFIAPGLDLRIFM